MLLKSINQFIILIIFLLRKETAWREYQARKKWQQTWGKDYEELAKWRDQIKIPAVEQRHIEKGNIRTSYNPWLNPIEIEVKPTNRVPRTSSGIK